MSPCSGMSMGERRRQLREQGGAARQKGASPNIRFRIRSHVWEWLTGRSRIARGAVHCRFMRCGGRRKVLVSPAGGRSLRSRPPPKMLVMPFPGDDLPSPLKSPHQRIWQSVAEPRRFQLRSTRQASTQHRAKPACRIMGLKDHSKPACRSFLAPIKQAAGGGRSYFELGGGRSLPWEAGGVPAKAVA